MTDDSAAGVHFDHPLREYTRIQRRWLLLTSLLGLLVARGGVLPTRVGAFGLEFAAPEQRWLIGTCGLLILYFLFGFCVHAFMDFIQRESEFYKRWDREDRPAREILKEVIAQEEARSGPLDKLVKDVRDRLLMRFIGVTLLSGKARIARDTFEFLLPIAFALFVIVSIGFAAFGPNPALSTPRPLPTHAGVSP